LQGALFELTESGAVKSAHDLSSGGIGVSFAECSIAGNIGARGIARYAGRGDATTFGESRSRVLLSCSPQNEIDVDRAAQRYHCAATSIGMVGGTRLRIGSVDVPVSALREAYETGLAGLLQVNGPRSWHRFASNERREAAQPDLASHWARLRAE